MPSCAKDSIVVRAVVRPLRSYYVSGVFSTRVLALDMSPIDFSLCRFASDVSSASLRSNESSIYNKT